MKANVALYLYVVINQCHVYSLQYGRNVLQSKCELIYALWWLNFFNGISKLALTYCICGISLLQYLLYTNIYIVTI